MRNLPSCAIYKEYLKTASQRFNITIDDCRDRYGKYTEAEWEKLLKN
jgi:hypothetical protein